MKNWFRKTAKKLLIVLVVLFAVIFLFFCGAHVYILCACDAIAEYETPPENKEYVTNYVIRYNGYSYWRFRCNDKVYYETDCHHRVEPIAKVRSGSIIGGSIFSLIIGDLNIYLYDDDPDIKILFSDYSAFDENNNLYIRDDIDVSLKVENISYIKVQSIYDESVLNIYEEPEEIQYWIDKFENQEEWACNLSYGNDKDFCYIDAYFKEVPQLRCRIDTIATKDVPEVGFSKNAAVTQ